MKTIGILGGMSWESSIEYYRLINQLVKQRLGGLHSAKSVMVSVDFAPVEACMARGEWDQVGAYLVDAARQVESAGADLLLIATNTMHKLYDRVCQAVTIPVLHIADPTGEQILEAGLTRVGLLGTKYTMEQDFYRARLEDQFGVEVLVPGEDDRLLVDRIVFEELVLGVIRQESKVEYQRVINDLIGQGAQGVILGCTEIPLLIQAQDVAVPVFDTTFLHADSAVRFALDNGKTGDQRG